MNREYPVVLEVNGSRKEKIESWYGKELPAKQRK
jgi:hypothetical protein